MKQFIALILLPATLFMGTVTHAQGPQEALDYIDNLLDDASGLLRTACTAGDRAFMGISVDDVLSMVGAPNLESLLFVCDYRSVLRQAQRSTADIANAINTGGNTLGMNLLPRLFDNIGTNTEGAVDHADAIAEQRLAEMREDLRDSESGVTLADYQEAILEEIAEAETRALDAIDDIVANRLSFVEGTNERAYADALALNSVYYQDTVARVQREANVARQAAMTNASLEAGNLALEEFINNTSYQETIIRTIDPTEGTAAQLEQQASRATSTREAVNELSRGWADYMRQDAVLSGSVIEGLKSIATQQSITNWQLSQEADRLYAQRYAAIEAERVAQEAEMLVIAEDFANTVDGFVSIFQEYNNLFLPSPAEGD